MQFLVEMKHSNNVGGPLLKVIKNMGRFQQDSLHSFITSFYDWMNLSTKILTIPSQPMMKQPVLKDVQKQNLETVGSPILKPYQPTSIEIIFSKKSD